MKKLLQRLPALPLAVGACAAATAVSADSPIQYIVAFIALLSAFAVVVYGKGASRWGMGAVALVTLTVSYVDLLSRPPGEIYDGVPRRYDVLVESVSESSASLRITGRVDAADGSVLSPFMCGITVSDLVPHVEEGMRLSVYGAMESPGKYAGIPFLDMKELGSRGAGSMGHMLVSPDDIAVTGADDSFRFRIASLRRSIAESIYSTPMGTGTSALLVSSCFGGNAGASVKERFRALGISHLLCVSGFHVGLVALAVGLLCFPLGVWSTYGRIRYVIIMVAVWLYALLCGLSPSVLRAAIMISAYYICVLMQSERPAWNGLLLSIAVIVMCRPQSLWAPGFQLSTGAVAGLITFADALNPVPKGIRGLHSLASLVLTPLAAMLGTVPVVLAWFHELPLLSVPANALAVILFPIFMGAGIVTAVLHAAGYPVVFLSRCMDYMYNALETMCDTGIDISGPVQLYLTPQTLCLVAAAIIAFAFVLHARTGMRRVLAFTVMTLCVTVAGCDLHEDGGGRLLVDGSRFATEAVLVHGCEVRTFTRAPLRSDSPLEEYLHGCGLGPDNVTMCDDYEITAGKTRVVLAGKGLAENEVVPGADYLVVDSRYRGSFASLLLAVRPATVVAGANLDAARVIALRDLCAEAGIRFVSLNSNALFLEY